jgi:para-nitrobenzyl esterase
LESEQAGVKVAESLGAHSLADLRTIPTDKLLQATGAFQADIDGWFLRESPATSFANGNFNKVPMILGSNSDEGQHMIRSAVPAKEFADRARRDYGAEAEKYLAVYPSDSDESAKASQQRQFADRTAFGERNLASDVIRAGAKVFLYYFSYVDTGEYNAEPPTLGLKLGADHGAELPYVFGLVGHWKTKAPDADLQLERTMMSYWTDFITRLDPNGPNLPVWKPFNPSEGNLMVLDSTIGMHAHPRAAQLDFMKNHSTGNHR